MPTTQENLAVAFAGESQANRKYLAFARQPEKEGRPQIARLFRAAAEAETVHALAHLASMGGVGTTLENLGAAVAGETGPCLPPESSSHARRNKGPPGSRQEHFT